MLPREAAHKTMDDVGGALVAIALVLVRRLRADRFHSRDLRAILSAVCADDRGLDRDLPPSSP